MIKFRSLGEFKMKGDADALISFSRMTWLPPSANLHTLFLLLMKRLNCCGTNLINSNDY